MLMRRRMLAIALSMLPVSAQAQGIWVTGSGRSWKHLAHLPRARRAA